jgi:hypothetical protein
MYRVFYFIDSLQFANLHHFLCFRALHELAHAASASPLCVHFAEFFHWATVFEIQYRPNLICAIEELVPNVVASVGCKMTFFGDEIFKIY